MNITQGVELFHLPTPGNLMDYVINPIIDNIHIQEMLTEVL